ncbi:glutamate carboxypeptidase [Streptomyces sp. V3I8]|uniref:M20 family metallopeptidase n=1 Tax=Streptomyces sp. V3I8 TaxID=3042279 RepID=UPI00278079B1|nr:M20 family metallopeptidase [Streptomyces sp. V3I8]MDQ1041236.1 glutamate carboxypeptidase [Streptomyces sp. V3I8]
MDGRTLLSGLQHLLPDMIADIGELVRCESPSQDKAATARSAAVTARLGERLLGRPPERLVVGGTTHLRWRLGTTAPRVLLLGHHDTVWPLGSLRTHPFRVEGGVMRGPGCFDMKAGVVMALYAAASLGDRSGVTLLITGDEEIGSPTSRRLIESEAARCGAALVLEAAADSGALKTQRKGVSHYDVQVFGRAAHAGLEPHLGVNATVELAHQALAVAALNAPERGTTVTPTVLSSGTTVNTVPAQGRLAVDVRTGDAAEQHRVDAALRSLRPVLPGARVEVGGGINRPPLTARASASLFAKTAAVAVRLGLPRLEGVSVGGASDGNFTAGVGTPTLDGLGAVGGGAHAETEHVRVDALPQRAALVASLMSELLRPRVGAAPPDASAKDR